MPGIPSPPGFGDEPLKLINPRCAVRFFGTEDILIDKLDIDFEIVKDLEEEPNEATITIYNLSENTRSNIIDPSSKNVPIELYFNPFGSKDLISAFTGEVDSVRNTPLRPGYSTVLSCSSQKWQHRALYVEKTYSMGTPAQQIIDELIGIINLPVVQIPPLVHPILLATSLTGPAFTVLRRFLFDYGRTAYIRDGELMITSAYTTPMPTAIKIPDTIALTVATPTERYDAVDAEMRVVTETTGLDPLQKLSKRSRKKYTKKVVGKPKGLISLVDDIHVEVEAIDSTIPGIERDLLALPTMQPDTIVLFDDGNQYRTTTVTHSGWVSQLGSDSEITTSIEADDWILSDAMSEQMTVPGFR